MKTVVQILNRPVRVELSSAAARACASRGTPLLVEMVLLFSCFIAKRTHFRDAPSEHAGTLIQPGLHLNFRAIMTKTCDLSHEGGGITHSDMPVENPRPYVPSWCRIGYAGGQWSCEFGYDRQSESLAATP